jgi:hypothetical protein
MRAKEVVWNSACDDRLIEAQVSMCCAVQTTLHMSHETDQTLLVTAFVLSSLVFSQQHVAARACMIKTTEENLQQA